MRARAPRRPRNLALAYITASLAVGVLMGASGEPLNIVEIPMTTACLGNNVPDGEYLKIESRVGGSEQSPTVVVSVSNPEANDRGILHEVVVVDPHGNPAGATESTSAYLVRTAAVDVETQIPFTSPTQDGYYVVLVRSASTDFADTSGAQDERLLVRVDGGRLTVVTREEYEANSNEAEARKLSDSQLEVPK